MLAKNSICEGSMAGSGWTLPKSSHHSNSLETDMLENQTIKEVRAARQRISEQHGHDLARLVDHYKKLQREKLERQAQKQATARVAEAPES